VPEPSRCLTDMIAELWSRAILKRIRARNEASSRLATEVPDQEGRNIKRVLLREARFEDFPEISAMNSRLGQGPDSLENWHRLWRDNPAIRSFNAPSRIGWLLEDSGRIVGFLGSIPLQYEFRGAPLVAAATCRFAVEPQYRAFSHLLVMAFFRQKEIQLFIDSSATPAAGKIMVAAKAQVLPQKTYESILFWVLNPRRYSAYALRKMGLTGTAVWLGRVLGQLVLQAASLFWNRRPPASTAGLEVRNEPLSSLGDRFEQFVDTISHRQTQLLARRSSEILLWHFEAPQNRRPVSLFTCYRNGQMSGYLVLRFYEESQEGLKRSVVADLLVQDDDPTIVAALLRAALDQAQKAGADVLEVVGFPMKIRECLFRWRPYSRSLPANPFYFKAQEKKLHEALQQEVAWYACPYDGDSTLWP
jgi:hypothetical protein